MARAGKLRIVGSGRNRVDLTHINNVVDAHLLAEGALLGESQISDLAPRSRDEWRASSADASRAASTPQRDKSQMPPPGGRAYFITNGEPVVLWDWINEVLRGIGAPEIKAHVPLPIAYAAGGLLETVWRLGRKSGEPPMTRFVAKEMATDHWFDISAARRDLGYHPLVTMAEATAEVIALNR
jgi:2-alkyl-3-oxoalkanoate reductase